MCRIVFIIPPEKALVQKSLFLKVLFNQQEGSFFVQASTAQKITSGLMIEKILFNLILAQTHQIGNPFWMILMIILLHDSGICQNPIDL
jgi:hypothetical protein